MLYKCLYSVQSIIATKFRGSAMTDEQFELEYPKDQYLYVRKRMRTKGTMGQTEIEEFDIILKETG